MSSSDGAPLRVIEISSGIAGAYCGWLLRQMGADVACLGPALRADVGADPITLARAFYAADKQIISEEAVDDAFAGADLIITDDAERLVAITGRSISEMAAAQTDTVFGVTSVFGLTGPLADVAAVPINAQAEAGDRKSVV